MLNSLKESLWKQFGASIDMLANAIQLWPEEYWESRQKFFYNAYHCIIFLDYYLTIPCKPFASPLPFTITPAYKLNEDAVDDAVPDRIYSKKELLDYLHLTREKCYHVIAGLTAENLEERWIEIDGTMNYAVLELLLYNLRHVQHHAAQLNLLLRQTIYNAPAWVSQAKEDLQHRL